MISLKFKSIILCYFAILLCFDSRSQSDQYALSLPEYNILYRGYNHIMELGTNNGYGSYKIITEGISLKKKYREIYHYNDTLERIDSVAVFIAKVTTTDVEAKIIFLDSISNDTLSIHNFNVLPLPPPSIYLGTIANGTSVSKAAITAMTRLFAKYPPEIPLNATFEVSSWEISVSTDGVTVNGNSPKLSNEALEKLKQVEKGSVVRISAKYKGMGYSGNMVSIIKIH